MLVAVAIVFVTFSLVLSLYFLSFFKQQKVLVPIFVERLRTTGIDLVSGVYDVIVCRSPVY